MVGGVGVCHGGILIVLQWVGAGGVSRLFEGMEGGARESP